MLIKLVIPNAFYIFYHLISLFATVNFRPEQHKQLLNYFSHYLFTLKSLYWVCIKLLKQTVFEIFTKMNQTY